MPPEFHPMFNDASDTDIIISSNEGTLFRLPDVILKRASGYFRSHHEPEIRSQADNPSRNHPLSPTTSQITILTDSEYLVADATLSIHSLPFPNAPLERVLLMISSLPTPPLSSYAELEAAIDVMEYLETPGPLSLARALCLTPPCLNEPILVYGLGSRFGWDEVTQRGAELTLPLNLLSRPSLTLPSSGKRKTANGTTSADANPSFPESKLAAQLSNLPGSALFKLLQFHRIRRDMFHAGLFSLPEFKGDHGGSVPKCPRCSLEVDSSPLSAFCSRLVWEMDQDASGKSILDSELGGLPEGKRCFEAKCPNQRCQKKLYDAVTISKAARECIESLPTNILQGAKPVRRGVKTAVTFGRIDDWIR